MKDCEIPGGATLWARQTINSEIFHKNGDWFKIWFYLVNRVSHKNTKRYKRGETFLQYEWVCEATDTTKDQVKKCVGWLREMGMVSTARSTRGVTLKILNYSYYQDLNNYYYKLKAPDSAPEKHQRSTREAPRYNKNDKNDKNDKNSITSDVKKTSQETDQIMKIFYKINPTLNWGNKTTRKACSEMIKRFGLDGTITMAKSIVEVQGKQYAPTATTPYQMKEKLAQFKVYFDRQKSNKPSFTKIS